MTVNGYRIRYNTETTPVKARILTISKETISIYRGTQKSLLFDSKLDAKNRTIVWQATVLAIHDLLGLYTGDTFTNRMLGIELAPHILGMGEVCPISLFVLQNCIISIF